MIDTTDNSNDSKNRVATIIISPDRKLFLIGHAPNRPFKSPNTWDLVGKGHIEYGADPFETSIRETFEEGNIDITDLPKQLIDSVKYDGGIMYIIAVVLPEVPENIICKSVFEWYGKTLPEFKTFKWIEFEEAETYLYKKLYSVLKKNQIFEKISKLIENGIM